MNRRSILSISESAAPVNERLLNVKETAEQLGVSKSWVYQSDLPAVKIGRRRLYRPSDIARYVNSRVSHRIGLGPYEFLLPAKWRLLRKSEGHVTQVDQSYVRNSRTYCREKHSPDAG